MDQHLTHDIRARLWGLLAIMVLVIIAVLTRLAYLQLWTAAQWRAASDAYGVRERRLPADRGQIRDRRGRTLVYNTPAYDLVAVPQFVHTPHVVAEHLATIFSRDADALASALDAAKRHGGNDPVVILPSLSLDDIARFLAAREPSVPNGDGASSSSASSSAASANAHAPQTPDLRGLEIAPHFTRRYTDGALAPHVLGYLKEIDDREIAHLNATRADNAPLYVSGDRIGVGGIERAWDAVLRGRTGVYQHVVDARGERIIVPGLSSQLAWQAAIPGATLQLTIDADVQRAAQQALGEKIGAVVALDPRTGAVLAMVSNPGYDLDAMLGDTRSEYLDALQKNPNHPFLARAIQSAYPPGSTYKMVIAAAALAEGKISPHDTVTCRGFVEAGGRRFGCWNKRGHGVVNLRRALAQSCDVYFYELGRRLGPDVIARYAHAFGLGEKTGIDLPHERSGLIPTTAWKLAMRKHEWSTGDTLSAAIGQGYDLVTPLQAALMMSVIANGGTRVTPHVVERVLGANANADIASRFSTQRSTRFSARWLTARVEERDRIPSSVIPPIVEGLRGVVEDPGGTAGKLNVLKLKIAGKTGTAQVVSLLRGTNITSNQDHAWFVAYAPWDDPTIAIAVLVEHGGHGGAAAAPIAGDVIRAYLQHSSPPSEPH